MIDHRQIQRGRCSGQLAGCPNNLGIAPGASPRVIVGEDQAGTAEQGGVAEDRADRHLSVAIAAIAREVEAARPAVDMRDPQALTAAVLQGGCEERLAGLDSREGRWIVGTLMQHG